LVDFKIGAKDGDNVDHGLLGCDPSQAVSVALRPLWGRALCMIATIAFRSTPPAFCGQTCAAILYCEEDRHDQVDGVARKGLHLSADFSVAAADHIHPSQRWSQPSIH
jgi:hypothetical protein